MFKALTHAKCRYLEERYVENLLAKSNPFNKNDLVTPSHFKLVAHSFNGISGTLDKWAPSPPLSEDA